MGLFSFIFSSDNSRSVKKLKKIADKVVALEEEFKNKSDEDLVKVTTDLKERIKKGESLMSVLPEAFANVREGASRVLNMRHFYVQILGGIALHQGRIAEMGTGEGKTLMATLPAYLNALTENGVHIVTVNEYLASRDAEWMGKVYKFLGLSVGVILNKMTPEQKRNAYACDITYSTNNEIGFDYLRDNMAITKKERVQRGFNFAIVDEVDSILIDEARTPLIISGRGMKSSDDYVSAQKFARSLKKDTDFEIDTKTKAINLTENGISKAERFFSVENISDIDNIELNHYIINALKANYIMIKDENYIVKDGEVLIVDEFTGRVMQGRRYSDGLHQAIEAKENVAIKNENKTLATITFQNLFRMYKKLSGMTGTAKTEESEFNSIYKLDVVQIPPNLPNIRKDEPDIIYTSVAGKIRAIVEEVKARHELGQPILIGTITIEKSEELSKALQKEKIKHVVLNAKNHESESEIVAQAGRLGAVTIATNMAGRGTDILLGGNAEFMAKKKMKEKEFTDEQISYATSFVNSNDEELNKAREEYRKLYSEFKVVTDKEKEEVRALGGLHIIGTERHESRRIDNQLRGRAGRQGDPGSTVFFISLKDDLASRFGGEQILKIANMFKVDENTPFQLRMLSNQIERAQKRIEGQNFAARRNVLQFDDVMNKQREIIYGERNNVLDGEDVHTQIVDMFPDLVSKALEGHLDEDKPYFDWNLAELNESIEKKLFPKDSNIITEQYVEGLEPEDLKQKLTDELIKKYDRKILDAKEIGLDYSNVERAILLAVVDNLWMQHIDQMSILKNEIRLQGYGNHDPIIEYKRVGFEMFDEMVEKIREETATYLLNKDIQIEFVPPKNITRPKDIIIQKQETATADKQQGRNELCSCGSGKKYKNCCGKGA